MRKNSHFAILFLLSLLGVNCHKDDSNQPGFDMDYHLDFVIQAGLGTDVEHHYYIKNIPSKYLTYLSQYGKTDADISKIFPSAVVLNGTYGDANYRFIDQAVLRVYLESEPNDLIEAAYRYPAPMDPGNTLALIPNQPDVKRILSSSRFSIDIGLRLRNITQEETNAHLDMTFRAYYK
ncbi:MAG: hypothetical protein KGS48_11305 [Bacteroidetes bacterium]|nr:hypothetical protein [Bacteroidota bacterium]